MSAGTAGTNAEETPDTLRVASDKQNYKPGENARLRIDAPFAGEGDDRHRHGPHRLYPVGAGAGLVASRLRSVKPNGAPAPMRW